MQSIICICNMNRLYNSNTNNILQFWCECMVLYENSVREIQTMEYNDSMFYRICQQSIMVHNTYILQCLSYVDSFAKSGRLLERENGFEMYNMILQENRPDILAVYIRILFKSETGKLEIYRIPQIQYSVEEALCGDMDLETIKTIFGVKQPSIKPEYPVLSYKNVDLKRWFRTTRLNMNILKFFIDIYGYEFLVDEKNGSNLLQDIVCRYTTNAIGAQKLWAIVNFILNTSTIRCIEHTCRSDFSACEKIKSSVKKLYDFTADSDTNACMRLSFLHYIGFYILIEQSHVIYLILSYCAQNNKNSLIRPEKNMLNTVLHSIFLRLNVTSRTISMQRIQCISRFVCTYVTLTSFDTMKTQNLHGNTILHILLQNAMLSNDVKLSLFHEILNSQFDNMQEKKAEFYSLFNMFNNKGENVICLLLKLLHECTYKHVKLIITILKTLIDGNKFYFITLKNDSNFNIIDTITCFLTEHKTPIIVGSIYVFYEWLLSILTPFSDVFKKFLVKDEENDSIMTSVLKSSMHVDVKNNVLRIIIRNVIDLNFFNFITTHEQNKNHMKHMFLHVAVDMNCQEFFKYIHSIVSNEKFLDIMKTENIYNENILQYSIIRNECMFVFLLGLMGGSFKNIDLLSHSDSYGDNSLNICARCCKVDMLVVILGELTDRIDDASIALIQATNKKGFTFLSTALRRYKSNTESVMQIFRYATSLKCIDGLLHVKRDNNNTVVGDIIVKKYSKLHEIIQNSFHV